MSDRVRSCTRDDDKVPVDTSTQCCPRQMWVLPVRVRHGVSRMYYPEQPGWPAARCSDARMTGPGIAYESICGERIIPVIFIISHAGVRRRRGYAARRFDFLHKPVPHETLLARVRTLRVRRCQSRGLQQRDHITKRFDALTDARTLCIALSHRGACKQGHGRRMGLSDRTVEV